MKKEKILNICGVVVGIAMLILGIVAIGSNKIIGGLTASKAEFGADFYTYVYGATRAAANNTSALVAIIAALFKCFGWGIVFSGVLVIIHYCKCLVMSSDAATAQEDTVVTCNVDDSNAELEAVNVGNELQESDESAEQIS